MTLMLRRIALAAWTLFVLVLTAPAWLWIFLVLILTTPRTFRELDRALDALCSGDFSDGRYKTKLAWLIGNKSFARDVTQILRN